MPAVGAGRENTTAQPKRKVRVKKPKPVTVAPADRVQERAVVRQKQLAKSKPKAGDAPQTRAKDFKAAEASVKKQYDAEKGKVTRVAGRKVIAYKPGTTVPPDVAQGAALKKVKVQRQAVQAARLAPVLKVLDQTTRPLHAVAAATKEDVRTVKKEGLSHYLVHGTSGRGIKAAGRGIQNKDKSTFSDVFTEAGWKPKSALGKIAKGAASLTADVVADPLSYATGGTSSVAESAARTAARQAERKAVRSVPAKAAADKASQQAVKRGATPKVAKAAGKAAARTHARRAGTKAGEAAAAGKTTNRGVTVRLAGLDVPGVARGTSAAKRVPRAVARKTRLERTRPGQAVDRAQQKVRDTSRNLASDFNPAIAPAGVDRAAYQSARRSARTARAGAQRGTYRAGQRAIAFKKAIGKANYAKVIDAIETGTVKSLPKELRAPARELEHDFAKMLKAERRAGLKVGDITRRGQKVTIPGVTADVSAAQKELRKAQAARARTERQVVSQAKRTGRTQGRAEVLVGQSTRRKRKKKPNASTSMRPRKTIVAAVRERGKLLDLQRQDVVGQARAAVREAERKLEETKALAHQERVARARATKAQAKIDAAPKGYVKHLRIKDEQPKGGTPGVGSKKVAPSFAKSRAEGTIAEKNAAEPGAYSESIPDIYLNRGAESAVARSKAKLNQSMVHAGRKPDRSRKIADQLGDNETLYKVDGADLVKVEPKSTEARTLPKGERYVILNEKLVSRTRGTVSAAAERSTSGVFFDKAQGVWKLAATQVNPGYHVRNLAGEAQNAYLAEGPITLGKNAVAAARALRQLGRDEDALRVLGAKPKQGPYTDFIRTAESVGAVRAGQLGREVGDMLGGASRKAKPAKARRGTLRKPARALKNVEDVFRLATYKGGIDRGLKPEMAMERASGNHFDYGDLTPLERKVLRRAAPFWTFSARDIPLQARTLLTNPSKFANYQKIREEFQNLFDVPDDWEKGLSESEQRSAPIPIKIHGKTYNIGLGPSGLPLTDLNEFPSTGNPVKQADEWMARAMSMLTPAAKTPVELWANMSFFFREPIERDQGPLVPAPKWVSQIPAKYRKDLGITNTYLDKRSGKTGWGAPAKLVYALNVLPGPIAFGNRVMTSSERPGQSTGAKAVGYLGPRVRQNDPLTVSINDLYQSRGKVDKKLNTLRQQVNPANGKVISAANPTAEFKKLSEQSKAMTAQIDKQRAQRGDKNLPPKKKYKVRKGSGFDFGGGSQGFDFGGGSADFDFGG